MIMSLPPLSENKNVCFLLAVIPELDQCFGAGSLWEQCVGDGCLYCVSAKTFMNTLSTLYASMLSDRADTGKTKCVWFTLVCASATLILVFFQCFRVWLSVFWSRSFHSEDWEMIRS